MHEMSLLKDIMEKINRIAQQEKSTQVDKVTITIGAMAHISSDHFKEHFYHAALGGPAEKAELDVIEATDPEDPLAQEIVLNSVVVKTTSMNH